MPDTIVIFTENNHAGGLDVFAVNLLNNWPDADDQFVLICNASHPGLDVVQRRLARPCTILRHKVIRYVDIVNRYSDRKILKAMIKALSPVLRYGFFVYYVFALAGLLRSFDGKLLIVNGGYPGGDMCRAAALAWALILRRAPSIHNFHNLVTKQRFFECLPEFLIDRMVVRCTRAFITVSKAAAASTSIRPALNSAKDVRVIYNGVDEIVLPEAGTVRSAKQKLGIPPTAKTCLMLATYEARKGHAFLFAAFRKVRETIPDCQLVICGFGLPREVERVRRLLKDLDLDRAVRLLGFRNDVATLFGIADVVVIPSQAFESFGLTSIEAMSCGVPVVATRIGGIPEVVEDGQGGYCVDAHDACAFAAKIVELCRDQALYQEQADRGRKRYRCRFTAAKMAAAYHAELSAS